MVHCPVVCTVVFVSCGLSRGQETVYLVGGNRFSVMKNTSMNRLGSVGSDSVSLGVTRSHRCMLGLSRGRNSFHCDEKYIDE